MCVCLTLTPLRMFYLFHGAVAAVAAAAADDDDDDDGGFW